MKRTTLFVPETLERELQLYAQREGRPMASVVREALVEYMVSRRAFLSLPSFTGRFDSGRSDVAEAHEDLLFAALTPHGDSGPPSPTPAAGRRSRRASTRRKR